MQDMAMLRRVATELWFDATARMAGPARWMEIVAPVIVAAVIALQPPPAPRDESDDPLDAVAALLAGEVVAHADAQRAARGTDVALVAAASGEAPAPARVLTHEQNNVVRFISRKYRVAIDEAQEFVYHAYKAAREFRVDPHLVLAVMSIESRFDPDAKSSAGAQGLMQVHTRVHAKRFQPFGGIAAAFDPIANIRVGTQILTEYIQRTGSPEDGLKHYVGAALAEDDGGYGEKVLGERERIAAAAKGRPVPPEQPVARVVTQKAVDRPVRAKGDATGDAQDL